MRSGRRIGATRDDLKGRGARYRNQGIAGAGSSRGGPTRQDRQPRAHPRAMTERRVIPIDELASEMRICRSTVYKLIKTGELRSIRVFRRHLVLMESYEDWIKRHETDRGQ